MMKWLITSLVLSVLGVSSAAPTAVYNGQPQISQLGAYVDSLDETAKSQLVQLLAPALAGAGMKLVDKLASKAINYVVDCVMDDCTAQDRKLQLTDQQGEVEKLLPILQVMENTTANKKLKKEKNSRMKDDLNAEMQSFGWISNPTTKDGRTVGYPSIGKFNGQRAFPKFSANY